MKKIMGYVMIVIMFTFFWGCEAQGETQEQYIYAFDGQSFDSASEFDCGYALVTNNDRTYFIDADGNEAYILPSNEEYKAEYGDRGTFYRVDAWYLGQGLCYVDVAEDCGSFIYDAKGNFIEANQGLFPDLIDSSFPVVVQGKMLYLRDGEGAGGNMLVDVYENTIFEGRHLEPRTHAKFGYFDDNGELVFPDYLNFENKNEPIYVEGAPWDLVTNPHLYYLLDAQGEYILNPDGSKFTFNRNEDEGSKENMYCFENGICYVADSNGVEEYLNDKGEFVSENECKISEGYSVFQSEIGYFGYKDSSGNVAVSPLFDEAYEVRNGLARVKEGEDFYYIIIGSPKTDLQQLQKEAFDLDSKSAPR